MVQRLREPDNVRSEKDAIFWFRAEFPRWITIALSASWNGTEWYIQAVPHRLTAPETVGCVTDTSSHRAQEQPGANPDRYKDVASI